MKQTKRILSLLLSLCLVLGLIPGTAFAADSNLPFTDVNTTDWCYDAVQYVYEKGMMNGTSTTTFSPDSTTTRGMIVTILHRMEGTPAADGTTFTDVPADQWYSNAVSWASANGIVGGYGNGKFGPGDPITREQMAAILNRYSTHKGYDVGTTGGIADFSDASQVSSYAVEPMGWAIGNGLISGVGNNTLAPKGNATRAQAATILMRFCKNIADKADTTPVTPTDKTYTVTFDLNYGSDTRYDAKTVKEGETVSKPSNPSRSGYSFSGWYAEKTGGRQFDFKTGITSDLTLYAHWSSNSSSGGGGSSSGGGGGGYVPPSATNYTVTFYMNDGTGAAYTTTSVVADEMVSKPADPTREGYAFSGWYENAECTEAYDFDLLVMENISLYAGWSQPGPYSITFDSAGGSAVPAQIVAENQIVVEPEDPEKEGYVFLGWLTSDNAYYEFDEVTNKNFTLTADWVEESEIDYVLDDILRVDGPEPVEQPLDGDGSITDVEVTYELDGPGKVAATQVKTGSLLRIPGYLTAVDINAVGGDVTDAVITFRYDPAQLAADGVDPQDLAIVWYDEANDIVVLLDSQVDTSNNTVSVTTGHFSEYAVVNVAEWMAAQTTQLPTIRTDEVPYYSIVMAMDCSGSMDGEKMSKSIEAAQNMIDVLADEDRITLLAFESSTRVVFDQVQLVGIDGDGNTVDNRDSVKSQIGSLSAYGGTDIERVLQYALQSKSDDAQYQSFVILLSDGQSSVSNSVLSSLKANGQRVIAVGIGSDVDQYLMQRIADATDGTYLYCQNAGDLAAAFRALQDAYIGSTEDSDGDSLPDLVETTGMRDQYGEIWTTDPNNPDTDGDGISDGEEMGLYHPLAQYPYFQRVSRPDLYTIKSDEAYLLMPENMMYSLDMDNNRIKLEVYVTDGGYRMVPDLLTPPDPDGIAKEYIYSQPRNLKVELSGLPDGVVIDSLNTVDEGLIPGTMATSYKTTAVLSYTKSVVLDNVTWTVTADNCSEWSGFAENGIKATYVQKTQSVPATKVKPKQEVSKADQAQLDLAQAALDIYKKLQSKVETKSNEPANNADAARAKVKSMINVSSYWYKEDANPSDELYDAFATAILEALDASDIEKYETNQNKMVNQIYKQIKGGLVNDEKTVAIDGVQYRVSYHIMAQSFMGIGAGVAYQDISWNVGSKQHNVILTWTSSADNNKALANYCAILAQLNKDLWTDFMSYYVSDAFKLMGITTVTKKDVDKVFAGAEKVIKALCNKDDADALVKEIGGKAEEKLKSGWTNAFKSFIKKNIPNGDKIVKAAERYKTAKEKYEEFQKFLSSSDEEKAAKAFSKFQDAYKKLDAEIDSII